MGLMWCSQYPWNLILPYALIAVIAYLMGGVNGAIITSRVFYRKDIRDFGSGNAGLTNFHRVFGVRFVALVVAIDILKTALPVIFAGWFMGLSGRGVEGSAFAGFFAMLGHAYPPYYSFRGGKTVLAAGTAVWFIDWRVAVIVWLFFALVVLLTRYVSLGSVLAGVAYPVAMAALGSNRGPGALVMVILSSVLLIFRHKENIKRLIKGNESKIKI